MVDIQVPPYHDVTDSKVQQNLLNKIRSGRYFAVLFLAHHAVPSHEWFGRTGEGHGRFDLLLNHEASTG